MTPVSRFIPWKNLTRLIIALSLLIPTLYFIVEPLLRQPRLSHEINTEELAKPASHPRSGHRDVEEVYNHPPSDVNVIRFGRCRSKITLAVVVCGDRRPMTLVTLKSALALALSSIHFAIIADDENRKLLADEILDWPSSLLKRLSFEIHPITFPSHKSAEQWRKLFKLCAAQRLFLPSLLQDVETVIYCDTDTIFLRPIDDLWDYFGRMNASQMAGLSPEHEDYATGWYNRFAKHPYYKPLGINSGVMLMNLTRMRAFQWESYLEPIFREYKLKIVWGDQDIINIIFHYHPEKLLVFGCEWNFRPDHCMYSRVCKPADVRGISVLHGNRGVFVNGKQPAFRAIYQGFQGYDMGSDLEAHLLNPLKLSIASTSGTNCGRQPMAFLRRLQATVAKLKTHKYPSACGEQNLWVAPS